VAVVAFKYANGYFGAIRYAKQTEICITR